MPAHAPHQPSTGHPMKLYRNTGSVASETWVEIAEIGDVSITDFARGLAELKRRGKEYTKNLASIIQSIAVEFRFHHGLDQTNWDALVANFLAGTVEEYFIADGPEGTADHEGLRCPMIIEQFPWDQPLEDISGHDIRLAIGYMVDTSTEVDPSWQVES